MAAVVKVYQGHLAWIPEVTMQSREWVGDGWEEEERVRDDS